MDETYLKVRSQWSYYYRAALARLSKKQSASRAIGIAFNLILIPGAGALTKDRSDDTG